MTTNMYVRLSMASCLLVFPIMGWSAPLDLHITSDGNWKSNDTYVAGWQTKAFDDSTWSYARAPYPNPVSPDTWIPGTSAKKIWHDPAGSSNGRTGPNEAFFRHSFNLSLAADSIPFVGQALIAVDDDYELFVNGMSVYLNDDGGFDRNAQFVDFTSSLVNGENVIAIHAVDGAWSSLNGTYCGIGPCDRLYEFVLFDGRIRTVPEPTSLLLLGAGLIGLLGIRNTSRQNLSVARGE